VRRLDEALDIEIAVARPSGPEQNRFICHGYMHGIAIGLRIDRDGAQTHGRCGTHHAHRDLAAVGDQEGTKWTVQLSALHRNILKRPNRVGSMGAFAAAERPNPNTSRVSAGSITPSSQRRAVA